MSKKKLLAIALTLTAFVSAFAVLRPASSTEYIDVDDYCWIEGVLHSDTYTLYPYAEESIDIGFSKYGEMIGYDEDTEIGLGIQYPGYEGAGNTYDQKDDTSVDPFCNEYINPDWWMNGWFIDIKYRTPAGVYREVWAFAQFSDGQQYGGDWIIMPSVGSTSLARPLWQEYPPYAHPDSTKYVEAGLDMPEQGGRKTNGHCVTDPIEIIYNGPRRFIALTKTTISDVGGGADLVAIYITFIFNKAEKNVILLKDVKRLYTKQPMNIQFGNRGEWDLGLEGRTDSYVHWYTDEPVQYWDMDENGEINATEVETSFEFFKDYFLTYKTPKKWWDDVPYKDRPSYVYNEFSEVARETFPATWLETQETCYGREWHWDKSIKEHSYAVAQIISKAGLYVGALAVWPHPEFWSAANTFFPPAHTISPEGNNPSTIPLMLRPISRMLEWHRWTVEEDPNQGEEDDLDDRDDIWVKADDIRMPDGSTLEPIIPFIIYEHDFKLSASLPEYRVVSVYMLTDYHDADDADADDAGNEEDWSNGVDRIDREIQYQLDEIFDPWDLYDAMHKNTKRWVQFFTHDYLDRAWDGENYYIVQLDDYREIESGELIPSLPVISYGDWDAYCSFSERVLVDTGEGYELIYPYWYHERDPIYEEDTERPYYSINYYSGMIWLYEWDDDAGYYVPWYLPEDSVVKVLWSSEHHATTAEQWDEDDLLYPIDGETFIFPLHHDLDYYKELTEVFLVEQSPERLWEYYDYYVTPSVATTVTDEVLAGAGTYPAYTEWMLDNEYVACDSVSVKKDGESLVLGTDYTVIYSLVDDFVYEAKVRLLTGQTAAVNVTASYYYYTPGYIELYYPYDDWWCKELDVKYHIPDYFGCESGFIEEKFHIDLVKKEEPADSLMVRTVYNLSYPMDFVEKVWIHSEKALLGGDYVFNQASKTLYMQDPVPAGEWLQVEYTDGGGYWTDVNFFKGDGEKTVFGPLAWTPDLDSLVVYNTKIFEQVVDEDEEEPEWDYFEVPKQDSYWDTWDGGTYQPKTRIVYSGLEEREWLVPTDVKIRGNWIIHESPEGDDFSTCDELVLDQAPLDYYGVNEHAIRGYWPGQELKIVFKVPSGRWEWAIVGEPAASVDVAGAVMTVAAFKNKLMEFGLSGLDRQDETFGPMVPWMIREGISPDALGRYHLRDDWCYSLTGEGLDSSWPIASSNIITVGGPYPNMISKYFNEFAQAMVFTTLGDGFFAVTCWDHEFDEGGWYDGGDVDDQYGYAVISTYKDKNGTIGFMVYGWTGQDTYYACKWFDEHKFELQHINLHVTDLVLEIEYKDDDGDLLCPPEVSIVEKLGTISEKPQHDP